MKTQTCIRCNKQSKKKLCDDCRHWIHINYDEFDSKLLIKEYNKLDGEK
ncbi:MAG: hypothetical protein WC755_09200 [Candidatus Woesearchaeota archaeon]|jgi:hypothetical protein